MIVEPTRYPTLTRWVHWASALLVLVAYLTSEAAEEQLQTDGAGQWHVLAGLMLLLLFLPRMAGYMLARRGASRLTSHSAPAARIAAVTIHAALLLFVIVQPLLGVLSVWAEGDAMPIPFTPWALSPMMAFDAKAGHTLEEAHEVIGNLFYAVIGIHVLAALWHHFVRRDATLRRML